MSNKRAPLIARGIGGGDVVPTWSEKASESEPPIEKVAAPSQGPQLDERGLPIYSPEQLRELKKAGFDIVVAGGGLTGNLKE
jgi:hypothetical protein